MFVYATTRLGLSEAEAYLRINVARIARRLPIVLDRLAAGRIQLSAIVRLAPHLTGATAEPLLDRAEGLSKRQVEELAAELAPKPDAPAMVRRLPAAPPEADQLVPSRAAPAPLVTPPEGTSRLPPRPPSPVLVPLAPARYKIQFTASSETEGKLGRARALLRHRIPDGDVGAIFDLALTVLVADLERGKWSATDAPRQALAEVDTTPSSRHLPAAVQRAAWQRDGGRCTFTDASGRRCPAVAGLEFHHAIPFALGGDHSLENVHLLCKAHNRYQAELDFGAGFVRQRIAERRATRSREGT